MMGSTTMKRLLIYYWYNVRWSRLLLLLVLIGVLGLLLGPRLFGSQSHSHKSKFGAVHYRVLLSSFIESRRIYCDFTTALFSFPVNSIKLHMV